MAKAVLVMDMPENCAECVFCRGLNVCKMKSYMEKEKIFSIYTVDAQIFCNTKPDWCPLRKLPERMLDEGGTGEEGWNACLDEIEGSGVNE